MRAPLVLLVLAWILTGQCGCMQAIAQPGQTPAQVSACTSDATWHNVMLGASGVASGGAATQASIAATQDPNVAKALAVASAVTAGSAAAFALIATLFDNAYTTDGCKPSLP